MDHKILGNFTKIKNFNNDLKVRPIYNENEDNENENGNEDDDNLMSNNNAANGHEPMFNQNFFYQLNEIIESNRSFNANKFLEFVNEKKTTKRYFCVSHMTRLNKKRKKSFRVRPHSKTKNHVVTDGSKKKLYVFKENDFENFLKVQRTMKRELNELNKSLLNEKIKRLKLIKSCVMFEIKNKKLRKIVIQSNKKKLELADSIKKLQEFLFKETKRFEQQKEAICKEYYQIMSERDLVHKEMDALHEKIKKIEESNQSVKAKKLPFFENTLKQNSSISHQLNDTSDQELSFVDNPLINSRTSTDKDNKTKLSSLEENLLEENKSKRNFSIRKSVRMNGKKNETTNESPKKETIALEEKIKKERESIRALCDELREQRDKAIRDLTESIRESDELKRQKNLAYQQIQKLQEQLSFFEDKFSFEKSPSEASVSLKKASDESQNQEESVFKLYNFEIIKEKDKALGVEFIHKKGILYIDEYEDANTDLMTKKNKHMKLYKSLSNSIASPSSTQTKTNRLQLRKYNTCETFTNQNIKYTNNVIISRVKSSSLLYDKIKADDVLVKVNDVELKNKEPSELESFMLGLEGKISFTVLRNEKSYQHKNANEDEYDDYYSGNCGGGENSNKKRNNEAKSSNNQIYLSEIFDFEAEAENMKLAN